MREEEMSVIFKLVDKRYNKTVAEFDNPKDAAEKQIELTNRLRENGVRENRYILRSVVA